MAQDYLRILTNLEARVSKLKESVDQLEGAKQAALKSLQNMGLKSPEAAKKYIVTLEKERQEIINELENEVAEIREILNEYDD